MPIPKLSLRAFLAGLLVIAFVAGVGLLALTAPGDEEAAVADQSSESVDTTATPEPVETTSIPYVNETVPPATEAPAPTEPSGPTAEEQAAAAKQAADKAAADKAAADKAAADKKAADKAAADKKAADKAAADKRAAADKKAAEEREALRVLYLAQQEAAQSEENASGIPDPSYWDRMARCETGGNWSMTGPSYSGGVGFYNKTWDAWGGREFADKAGNATREQQIIVANRVATQGWQGPKFFVEPVGYSGWGCVKTIGYP